MNHTQTAVIGGGGFIGRHVVSALTDAGHTPMVVSQEHTPFDGVEVRVADVTDTAATTEALEGCTSVIHLAARAGGIQMQDTSGLYRSNRAVTDSVLDACATLGIADVFIASSQVVYRNAEAPLDETAPIVSSTDDPTQYAWSKASDEVIAKWWGSTHGRRVVIGRFGNIYGAGAPYDETRSTVVHALVRRFCEAGPGSGVDVWGDGSAVRSFLYVADAAAGVVAVLDRGVPGGVYNIDSGVPHTIADLARIINRAVGNDLELVFDSTKPSGVPYRVGSIDRLTALGFEPSVSLSDGIDATVDDFRSRASDGEFSVRDV
ncbi:MAG: NAD-dependent epimerase/dehydratase family protein [Acidimicrobiia bacterium]|nr:NAD-dependent epimerase/dehydratase family protein [Acidimicrobiia bacterium]